MVLLLGYYNENPYVFLILTRLKILVSVFYQYK